MKIPGLRELYLSRTSVTADGLAQLGPLQTLTLTGPQVSDAVLARIDALQSVESLTLLDTSVTSAGIAPLARLKNLRWLRFLRNHRLDAAALETIGSLTKLDQLDFVDTTGPNGSIDRRLVTTGAVLGDDEIEILSGVRPGERVIVAGGR